jgi:hypothetical protein
MKCERADRRDFATVRSIISLFTLVFDAASSEEVENARLEASARTLNAEGSRSESLVLNVFGVGWDMEC